MDAICVTREANNAHDANAHAVSAYREGSGRKWGMLTVRVLHGSHCTGFGTLGSWRVDQERYRSKSMWRDRADIRR
eukprot:1776563-Prymnesium_polylepis.1